jgi:hypothetical protein
MIHFGQKQGKERQAEAQTRDTQDWADQPLQLKGRCNIESTVASSGCVVADATALTAGIMIWFNLTPLLPEAI